MLSTVLIRSLRGCQQGTYQGNGISRGADRGQAGQVASPRVFCDRRRGHLLDGSFSVDRSGLVQVNGQTDRRSAGRTYHEIDTYEQINTIQWTRTTQNDPERPEHNTQFPHFDPPTTRHFGRPSQNKRGPTYF